MAAASRTGGTPQDLNVVKPPSHRLEVGSIELGRRKASDVAAVPRGSRAPQANRPAIAVLARTGPHQLQLPFLMVRLFEFADTLRQSLFLAVTR